VLDRLEAGLGLPPVTMLASPAAGGEFEREAKAFEPKRWKLKAGIGYDPDFLPGVPIDLQQIYAQHKAEKHTAPLLTGGGDELKYNHFSVVIHKTRKFALLTAVNILGKRLDHPGPRNDAWRIDPRMAPEYQPAGNFYIASKGTDKVQFSRGHLVRRFDPCWGNEETVKKAEEDTFHYVNAAPQFQKFNDVDWGNLEDYVLDRAQMTEARMSVFTGPIFSERDPVYGRDRVGGPWRIPVSYWKIAILDKGEGNFAAAAFIVGQTQYIKALYEAKVFAGLKPYRMEDLRSRGIQTTIATIEQETGLDFSAIREFDSQGSLEATRRTRWINRLDDILI
jgi:endonuclease G